MLIKAVACFIVLLAYNLVWCLSVFVWYVFWAGMYASWTTAKCHWNEDVGQIIDWFYY